MTNDTEKCHGWTVSTLFTHLSALLGAQEKAVKVAQDGADRALLKAETALEKRLDGVNEFRATLADQQRTLIPRSEAELRFKSIEDRITSLELQRQASAGMHQGLSLGWSILLGALGAGGIIFGLLKK